jgi:hypothetical protein
MGVPGLLLFGLEFFVPISKYMEKDTKISGPQGGRDSFSPGRENSPGF